MRRLIVGSDVTTVSMAELLGSVRPGGIARAARATPQRSRQWTQPAREGRERAPREATDGKNGVIRSAGSASPPHPLPLFSDAGVPNSRIEGFPTPPLKSGSTPPYHRLSVRDMTGVTPMELITLSIAGSTLVLLGQSCVLIHDQLFGSN